MMAKKTGRPLIEIDKTQFENLCFMQCTLEEIAGFFRVNEKTIMRWCKREYNDSFGNVYKRASAGGKTSLRREQWKAAKKGNITMLIWLGKQWLGQTERIEQKSETVVTEGNQVIAYVPDDGRENGNY